MVIVYKADLSSSESSFYVFPSPSKSLNCGFFTAVGPDSHCPTITPHQHLADPGFQVELIIHVTQVHKFSHSDVFGYSSYRPFQRSHNLSYQLVHIS